MTTDYATKNRWQNRVRWSIAYRLNNLPGMCWANLVSWALHSRPIYDRHGDGDIRQDWMCRADADSCGRCYCGKLTRASLTPECYCPPANIGDGIKPQPDCAIHSDSDRAPSTPTPDETTESEGNR